MRIKTERTESSVHTIQAIHIAFAFVRIRVVLALNEEARAKKRFHPWRPYNFSFSFFFFLLVLIVFTDSLLIQHKITRNLRKRERNSTIDRRNWQWRFRFRFWFRFRFRSNAHHDCFRLRLWIWAIDHIYGRVNCGCKRIEDRARLLFGLRLLCVCGIFSGKWQREYEEEKKKVGLWRKMPFCFGWCCGICLYLFALKF